MDNSVFISYNSGSETEQALAIRLYTIGALNGLTTSLPDRGAGSQLTLETKGRITLAKWFVCFSMQPLTPIVQREIEYAYLVKGDKSKIIVIYNVQTGRNLINTEHVTEFMFDPNQGNLDEALGYIIQHIKVTNSHDVVTQQQSDGAKALVALLGVGLGLFTLGALLSDEDEASSSKSTKAKRRSKR